MQPKIPLRIQCCSRQSTGWTHCSTEFAAMPPQLTDYELETAARACWVLAHRESEDAAKIADPRMG